MTLETAGFEDLVTRVATLETETIPQTHRPDDSPSPLEEWEPIITYNGIKWLPTYAHRGTCEGCPVYDECLADVNRGDFAWCERAIPEDFQLTNSEHTAYSHAQLATDN